MCSELSRTVFFCFRVHARVYNIFGDEEKYRPLWDYPSTMASTRQHRSWKVAAHELLTVYRATEHATTGKSPAELLHNRPMTTTLNIGPTEIATECMFVIALNKNRKNTSSRLTRSVVQCNRVFKEGTMCVSRVRDILIKAQITMDLILSLNPKVHLLTNSMMVAHGHDYVSHLTMS